MCLATSERVILTAEALSLKSAMTTIDRSYYRSFRLFQQDPSGLVPRPFQAVVRLFPVWRTGSENPKWRQQVQNLENATTPLTAERLEWRGKRGYHRMSFKWDPVNAFNSDTRVEAKTSGQVAAVHHMIPSVDTGWSSTADARARARFYSEVRRAQVQWSGPTFLGEIRQTLHQLRHPAGALGKKMNDYIKRVRKIPRRSGREDSWLKAVGGAWLEYSFGMVPLMHDIQEATDAYNGVLEKTRVQHISRGATDSKSISVTTEWTAVTQGSNKLWFLANSRLRQVHTVRYRGAVAFLAATTASDRFARFGFTPSEFIPTAWELLPWSFLIDYFTNIGDILEASVTDTSGLRWVNKSDLRRGISYRLLTPDREAAKASIPANSFISQDGQSSWSEYSRTRVTRTVGVGLTPPELIFELPDGDRSPLKLLNIAALLTQAIDVHPQRTKGRSYRL